MPEVHPADQFMTELLAAQDDAVEVEMDSEAEEARSGAEADSVGRLEHPGLGLAVLTSSPRTPSTASTASSRELTELFVLLTEESESSAFCPKAPPVVL